MRGALITRGDRSCAGALSGCRARRRWASAGADRRRRPRPPGAARRRPAHREPGPVSSPPRLPTSRSQAQIYEQLTHIDAANRPVPDLAAGWESGDGTTWTFFLRQAARFSDGRPVTAADVVWTFDRLRDRGVGTPVLPLYRNILEVQGPRPHAGPLYPRRDKHRVRFRRGRLPRRPSCRPARGRSKSGSAAALHVRLPLSREPADPQAEPLLRRQVGRRRPLPRLSEIHFIFSSDLRTCSSGRWNGARSPTSAGSRPTRCAACGRPIA